MSNFIQDAIQQAGAVHAIQQHQIEQKRRAAKLAKTPMEKAVGWALKAEDASVTYEGSPRDREADIEERRHAVAMATVWASIAQVAVADGMAGWPISDLLPKE